MVVKRNAVLWQLLPLSMLKAEGCNFRDYYVQLQLYTYNFGGINLKRNYIWGYANKKRLNTNDLACQAGTLCSLGI
jgi:hypothetical protein